MLAPAIAASLNANLPARSKGLYVDGLDVLKNTEQGYGVPISSIELVEAAPGQVSSLKFTIDDPNGVITIADGAQVRFADLARGPALFLGWVSSVSITAFGIGRFLAVECVGVESVLDWWQVPAITWTSTQGKDIIAGLVARCYKTGGFPLRVAASAGTGFQSSLTYPTNHPLSNTTMTTPAGSLRAAIMYVSAVWVDSAVDTFPGKDIGATVDFYGNLRTPGRGWTGSGVGYEHQDFAYLLTIDGATIRPSATEYQVDGGSATRGVVVTGSGVTVMVTDGTTATGQVAPMTSTSTTTDGARATGLAYLKRNARSVTGSVTVDDALNAGSVGNEQHAGMGLMITDPNVGLSSTQAPISEIIKSFNADGTETWVISWGAPASGAMLVRALTASTTV